MSAFHLNPCASAHYCVTPKLIWTNLRRHIHAVFTCFVQTIPCHTAEHHHVKISQSRIRIRSRCADTGECVSVGRHIELRKHVIRKNRKKENPRREIHCNCNDVARLKCYTEIRTHTPREPQNDDTNKCQKDVRSESLAKPLRLWVRSFFLGKQAVRGVCAPERKMHVIRKGWMNPSVWLLHVELSNFHGSFPLSSCALSENCMLRKRVAQQQPVSFLPPHRIRCISLVPLLFPCHRVKDSNCVKSAMISWISNAMIYDYSLRAQLHYSVSFGRKACSCSLVAYRYIFFRLHKRLHRTR